MTVQRKLHRLPAAWLALFVPVFAAVAQTPPVAQPLPYEQDFGSTTFTVLPQGLAAWNGLNGASISTVTAAAASAPTGDANVSSATVPTTTGGSFGFMSGGNARYYTQTSSNSTNGVNQLALALVTTGWTQVTLAYDVEIIHVKPRTIGVLCQYRIGSSGAWTTLTASSGSNPYSQAGGTAGVKTRPLITLPPAAENQPLVQIRWAFWRGSETGDSSGAAIDQISVTGTPAGAVLSASLEPPIVAEADGPAATQLTVTRTGALETALAVTLAFQPAGVAAYDGPNPFSIPAGQASVTVPIRAVDNDLLDGDKSVTLTLTAPAAVAAQTTLEVLDDEDSLSPPAGYYASAAGLTGAALKAVLKFIASPANYRAYAYSDTFNPLRSLDEDPDNSANVLTVYSGAALAKNSVYFPGGPDANLSWSREHLWPVSYGLDPENADPGSPEGGDAGPDYTDLFNLRPCIHSVNNLRGNRYYDATSGVPSIPALAPECSYDTNSWAPRPEERGDIARVILYMATRYDGTDALTLDLELSNSMSASAGRFGRLSTLLRWHQEDPVSLRERQRNQRIFSAYQRNRNPFVDRPEFVSLVWGGISKDKESLTLTEGQPGEGVSFTLAAAPTADVTLTFTATPTAQISFSPSSLTFTTADWQQPKTVVITAVDDTLFEPEMSVTVQTSLTSDDTRYAELELPALAVTVISDDPAIQPAALPISYGGPWSPLPVGFLGQGLGAPYSTSLGGDAAAGSARFDTTGARLIIAFNAPAAQLSYHLRGNPAAGSATSGTFLVQHSADGEVFTDLRHIVDKNNTDQLFTDALPRSARYVAFVYSQKIGGNLQLDKLLITAAPSYLSWAASYGLTGAAAAALADEEKDGLVNLTEYALGGHPTQPDAAILLPQPSRVAGRLRLTAIVRGDDPSLSIQAATSAGLTDPGSWSTSGVIKITPVDQSGVPAGFERVTFESPLSGDRVFMRLEIGLLP